jgi:alpha-D-xyloside xylohydrolase
MKERHWCDFEWDKAAFPDPRGMIHRLKQKGLKICLWINPYISQMSKIFDEGREHGYFLKRADGSIHQIDQWQPGMAIVDFTNPAAVDWFKAKLRRLLDMGVDCFKTDFGERIPDDAVYHDGSDPKLMHNFYSYTYNKAVFELLESYHGKGEAMVFARAATAGSQKFPVHWGGDCNATFESMAEDLRGGLSFCMSGAAFWSHDIGGFTGTATPALYKRWVAFGLLSTHSRLHGSGSYRVPWLFDEESVEVMQHFARLKNQLFPYLFAAAHDAHLHGCPVMRAMMLEYPNDPACQYLDRQYMLGGSLLVAPVFRADDIADYYLPKGRWTSLLGGEQIEGGQWRSARVDFLHIPLFVRENSIVPMSTSGDQTGWRTEDELMLELFEIADGADLSPTVYDSDTQERTAFRCQRSGPAFMLQRTSGDARCVRVLLRNCRNSLEHLVNGNVLARKSEGLLIDWVEPSRPLSFVLGPAPAGVEVDIHRVAVKGATAKFS